MSDGLNAIDVFRSSTPNLDEICRDAFRRRRLSFKNSFSVTDHVLLKDGAIDQLGIQILLNGTTLKPFIFRILNLLGRDMKPGNGGLFIFAAEIRIETVELAVWFSAITRAIFRLEIIFIELKRCKVNLTAVLKSRR